jgi:hypothetical protein
MNLTAVERIAKAVLYEGYMLYPYRPSSVKNQQRWNFGVLCPQSYSEAQNGSEAHAMQTECLVAGTSQTKLEVRVRFLQLVDRTVGELVEPASELAAELQPDRLPQFRTVAGLDVNGRRFQPWQEAVEREIILPARSLEKLAAGPVQQEFAFPAEQHIEPLYESDLRIVGVLLRKRNALSARVEIQAVAPTEGVFRVKVLVRNSTPFVSKEQTSREEALLKSLVSTHTVLGVQDGKLISLIAPPVSLSHFAAACVNVGTWPVLVGEDGDSDTMLSAPIILYDHPQIAPESAGDLFDGTEIDEILSLRIMTLTHEEKREMSQSDERARQVLERTENMPAEQFMKLHGVLRGLRPVGLRSIEPRPIKEMQ